MLTFFSFFSFSFVSKCLLEESVQLCVYHVCDFSARYGNYSMKVFTYIIYILEACSYNRYTWGLELGFNATTMFQLCRGGQLNWWRKPEFPEKTTHLRQSRTNFITY